MLCAAPVHEWPGLSQFFFAKQVLQWELNRQAAVPSPAESPTARGCYFECRLPPEAAY